MIKVKVCCISSIEEALLALDAGADALGLVSEMPSGPGPIPESEIISIIKSIPQETNTFLLTSKQNSLEILDQLERINPRTLQIVDEVETEVYGKIRKEFPETNIVQVIHVKDKSSIEQAISIQNFVDYILLDSGNPDLKVKTLGGTGNTHNWNVSAELVKSVKIPVYLAGGLKPANVKTAIESVRPYGVDLCSGVRSNGNLDEKKVREFIRIVKSF